MNARTNVDPRHRLDESQKLEPADSSQTAVVSAPVAEPLQKTGAPSESTAPRVASPVAKLEAESATQEPASPSSEATAPPRQTLAIRVPSVSAASDLVDAPSIGPKTAQRFAKIGVHTIGEFLAGSPSHFANKLQTRWITEDLVCDWQAQARLVCDLATLCGYKSQILVALDIRQRDQLANEDSNSLAQRIAAYCETKAGQRILRSSPVPSQPEVASWIDEARGDQRQAA